ncbi:MAG TPA: hypothetical protein VMV09_02080 [Candidatus Saccharimonadales bacterium]|nr:hypothetical protein [Candidatus Saccharimonadales bacterium]
MTKRTVITNPDGSKTVIEESRSKAFGGLGCLGVLAALFLIGGPAAYFPLPLAILAYVLEGALLLAFLAAKFKGRSGGS